MTLARIALAASVAAVFIQAPATAKMTDIRVDKSKCQQRDRMCPCKDKDCATRTGRSTARRSLRNR